MRKLWQRFQAIMTAAALAEEGEVEAARRIAAEADEGSPPEPDASRPPSRRASKGLRGMGSRA